MIYRLPDDEDVPLHGGVADGRVALVEGGDYATVLPYHWWALDVPSGLQTYAVTQVREGGRKRTIYMHKLITGWSRTDHEHHDGLDNRRRYLRPATQPGQNGANQRPVRGGFSAFKGVSRDPRRGHWVARIKIAGQQRWLGSFPDGPDGEIAAARAYDRAAREAWGPYACLNFPGAVAG